MYCYYEVYKIVDDKIIMTTDSKRNKSKVLMCNDLALCQVSTTMIMKAELMI